MFIRKQKIGLSIILISILLAVGCTNNNFSKKGQANLFDNKIMVVTKKGFIYILDSATKEIERKLEINKAPIYLDWVLKKGKLYVLVSYFNDNYGTDESRLVVFDGFGRRSEHKVLPANTLYTNKATNLIYGNSDSNSISWAYNINDGSIKTLSHSYPESKNNMSLIALVENKQSILVVSRLKKADTIEFINASDGETIGKINLHNVLPRDFVLDKHRSVGYLTVPYKGKSLLDEGNVQNNQVFELGMHDFKIKKKIQLKERPWGLFVDSKRKTYTTYENKNYLTKIYPSKEEIRIKHRIENLHEYKRNVYAFSFNKTSVSITNISKSKYLGKFEFGTNLTAFDFFNNKIYALDSTEKRIYIFDYLRNKLEKSEIFTDNLDFIGYLIDE